MQRSLAGPPRASCRVEHPTPNATTATDMCSATHAMGSHTYGCILYMAAALGLCIPANTKQPITLQGDGHVPRHSLTCTATSESNSAHLPWPCGHQPFANLCKDPITLGPTSWGRRLSGRTAACVGRSGRPAMAQHTRITADTPHRSGQQTPSTRHQ